MAKKFGSVELFDNDRLEEAGKEAGVYLDFDEVWQEAKDVMDENGTDSVEVRIRGLDYIEIYRVNG